MQTLPIRQPTSLSGVWHNQHGSEIDVVVLDDGRVTGSFSMKSARTGVQEQYPLSGFATADTVAFCVDFGKHESMTAWVGQTGPTGKCIEMMWQMVANAHHDPKKTWRSISTGSDTFMQGACPNDLEPSDKPPSHPLWCGII